MRNTRRAFAPGKCGQAPRPGRSNALNAGLRHEKDHDRVVCREDLVVVRRRQISLRIAGRDRLPCAHHDRIGKAPQRHDQAEQRFRQGYGRVLTMLLKRRHIVPVVAALMLALGRPNTPDPRAIESVSGVPTGCSNHGGRDG
jgi:hypothetical protein